MFKKLKDKITEEVRIPPIKFPQSMQQLAQAVSPNSNNNNNTPAGAASNDNFSIGGDFDDTPQNSPERKKPADGGVAYRAGQATPFGAPSDSGSGAGFTLVDLEQDSSSPQKTSSDFEEPSSSQSGAYSSLASAFNSLRSGSRRSSISSVTSDNSFMFPVLESSGPTYNFQSDLESCSEASDSVGANVSKEQLLAAYRKIQQRYHKYKGRYADLAKHYQGLERENVKAKNILAECQDKALRRMAELKEQCNLEKQAKAHLEEALRSDLEEKDHLIHTLETKIELLKGNTDQNSLIDVEAKETRETEGVQEDLLTGDPGPVLSPEVTSPQSELALKEKTKKLENLLLKCREDITNKREVIKQLETDKEAALSQVSGLEQKLVQLQKREEEVSLSFAEYKQTIHRELEAKEDHIKKLSSQLISCNKKVTDLQEDLVRCKEESKKEVAATKLEVTQVLQKEMQQVMSQNKNLEKTLAARDAEIAVQEAKAAQALQRLEEVNQELSSLQQIKLLNSSEEKEEKKEVNLSPKAREGLNACLSSLKDLKLNSQELKSEVDTTLTQVRTEIYKNIPLNIAEYLRHFQEQNEGTDQISASLRNQISELERDLSEQKNIVSNLKEELESERYLKEESVFDLRKMNQALDEELASMKESFEVKNAELEKKLSHWTEENGKLKAALQEKSSELSLLRKSLNEQTEALKEQENEKKSLRIELEDSSERLDAFEKQVDELSDKLKESEIVAADTMTLREILEKSNKEIEELKTDLQNSKEMLAISSAKCEALLSEKSAGEMNSSTELENIKAEYKNVCEANNTLIAENKVLESQRNEQMKKLDEDQLYLQEELETLRNSLKEKEQILTCLTEERTDIMNRLTFLTKDKAEIEKTQLAIENFQNPQEQLSRAVERFREYEQRVIELQTGIEEKDKEMQLVLSKLQNEEKEKAKLETELQNNKEKLDRLVSSLKKSQEECLNLRSEHASDAEHNEKQASELTSVRSKLDETNHLYQTSIEKVAALENQLYDKDQQCTDKNEQCKNLLLQLENLKTEFSEQKSNFEVKEIECVKLANNLNLQSADQSKQVDILKEKERECLELNSKLDEMIQKQLEESKLLKEKTEECKQLTSQLEIYENEKAGLNDLTKNQAQALEEKTRQCDDLSSQLKALMIEHEKLDQVLKQKISECQEKENQLDSLADEMKSVDELSAELRKISEESEANVQVLSEEASNLAQKVEELTTQTQEMKEREVELLAKVQVADDLEADYIHLKQTEMEVISKFKLLEEEKQFWVSEKNSLNLQISALEEENRKLRETEQKLPELIKRAKEAEEKCNKLEQDAVNLNERIEKVEESEMRCSILEENLRELEEEKDQLIKDLNNLKKNKAHIKQQSTRHLLPAQEDSENDVPVVEEPIKVRKFADLTEGSEAQGDDVWEEKYNNLLEEHNQAIKNNALTIAKLNEQLQQKSLESDMKVKERLWDRQDEPSLDGNSNGSFGVVEKLQQELASLTIQLKESKKQHRQEVSDLRRILMRPEESHAYNSSRCDNLDDSTELEYLRNILFEYMMGKEPMVLARVIAAVVKFDKDQTNKVLQKEQQRLSLLGQLGIS